jgi:hypothetical protein
MTDRTVDPMDDTSMDAFDRELRRFLEGESRQIYGAPSRAEMLDRVAGSVGARDIHQHAFGGGRTLRVLLVLALLAALLAGVVAVGARWVPRNPLVLAPSARPTLGYVLQLGAGGMPPGTYWIVDRTSTPFTLSLPAGWLRESDGEIHKGDPWAGGGVSINTWLVRQVYGDACHFEGTLRDTGTRELVVAALREQKGHTTSEPVEVILGGLPATRLEIRIPPDFDGTGCENADLRIWPDPLLDNALWAFAAETITIYVVEGDEPTAFTGIQRDDTDPGDIDAMQAIFASVVFQL